MRYSETMPDGQKNLIVALDFADAQRARALVGELGESVCFYKVGKELFTAVGPSFVRELVDGGKKVFLDLKFHDIPNTVAGAVRSAAELGVSMLTVHASGGYKMLRAATEAAAQGPAGGPMVLAVTVLTSMAEADIEEVGVAGGVETQVQRLATLALRAGCGGIVASAQEAAKLRLVLGEGFALVTPGIRPAGTVAGDQARVVTPEMAIRAGASYLVVGRPIALAEDPAAAARAIIQQIERAL